MRERRLPHLDDLPIAVAITDTQGIVLSANDELSRLTGQATAELIGQSFDACLTRPSQIFLETHVRPLLWRDSRVSEVVLHLKGPSGEGIPILVNATANKHLEKDQHTWVLFESHQRNEFERELIRAREDLKRLSRDLKDELILKDKLLMIVAHDLRGPVGSAAQLIDFVVENLARGESVEEYLKMLKRSMHGTFDLIQNLLGWAEVQVNNRDTAPKTLVLSEILHQVVAWLQSQANAKSIEVTVQCDPKAKITTDGGSTETIARNLISNAIKYSKSGQQVVIAGFTSPHGWSIEVRDQGMGVPPEKLPQLFGESRVDSVRGTAQEQGSGLGLMFCAELARRLGGRLEAKNNPNIGSTFKLIVDET